MLLIKNLETPRLTIRSWQKSDKDFALSLWGDKENGKYMSDPIRENMDEAYLKCVDEMEDNPEGYYLVAEWKEDGTPVGTCCIFPENENYDIGYCVSKDHGLRRKAASPSREKWQISILRRLRYFANLGFQRTEKRAIKNGEKKPILMPIIIS